MAKAIWSGSIGFGMVSIPVKLFGATESKDTHTIELSAFVKEAERAPRPRTRRASRRATRKVS